MVSLEVNFRRSVIIAQLWRPEVFARPGNFVSNLRFLEKSPLKVKFSKFCSVSFHPLTDWRCCARVSENLSDGKSMKSCVIRVTKKISAASQTVATAFIAPKICQASPNIWLTLFQISIKLVYFWRSYNRTREDRFWSALFTTNGSNNIQIHNWK